MKISIQDEFLYNLIKDVYKVDIIRMPNQTITYNYYINKKDSKKEQQAKKQKWLNELEQHGYENPIFVTRVNSTSNPDNWLIEQWKLEYPIYTYEVEVASLEEFGTLIARLAEHHDMYYSLLTISYDGVFSLSMCENDT